MKVLSIDWDFLVDASADYRCTNFPDCCNENYSEFIQNTIWSTRYLYGSLREVSVDKDALTEVKNYIGRTCSLHTRGVAYDSHKHIYDEVKSSLSPEEPLVIVNFDFHHDCYQSGNSVDCGNWVDYLYKDRTTPSGSRLKHSTGSSYTWVSRDDSDDAGIPRYVRRLTINQVSRLPEVDNFDLLYVCKSPMWSPPHLDREYDDFITWINKYITDVNDLGSKPRNINLYTG